MNKILILFILFSGIASAQKIDQTVSYQYSDDVEFKIRKIRKKRAVDRGYHTTTVWHIAEKGSRFIEIRFEFRNNSSEEQIVDFEKVFLMNEDLRLNEVSLVTMEMKLVDLNPYKQKLKPNSKRFIIVGFTHPFPKEEQINKLVIGDKIYNLQYLD